MVEQLTTVASYESQHQESDKMKSHKFFLFVFAAFALQLKAVSGQDDNYSKNVSKIENSYKAQQVTEQDSFDESGRIQTIFVPLGTNSTLPHMNPMKVAYKNLFELQATANQNRSLSSNEFELVSTKVITTKLAPGKSQQIDRQQQLQREARRLNFWRNLWNKPKVSPLFLVNGTVCRFINSTPICTTLQTTGLLRKFNQDV